MRLSFQNAFGVILMPGDGWQRILSALLLALQFIMPAAVSMLEVPVVPAFIMSFILCSRKK